MRIDEAGATNRKTPEMNAKSKPAKQPDQDFAIWIISFKTSGVALTLVKPLPKTALSGAAWWLSSKKAVIQLSARHKMDDHLWFSLFHEAAHLLLHSKKTIFTDSRNGESTDIEVEADIWASNKLIPRSSWNRFIATSLFNEAAIQSFAGEQGIAPGIVVGALQHEGHIPWSHMNGLKVRLEWK